MKATNIDLVGENKWGQTISKRLYSDDSGQKYVSMRRIGSLRREMMPYKEFAERNLGFNYIMEHNDSIRRCKYDRSDY